MKKYIFSAFYLMSFVLSQKTIEGLPMSFNNQLSEEYHVIEMPVVDVQKLLDEDAIAPAGTPTRYGKSHYVDYNLENSGTWEVIPNHGRVWRLKIISRNAFAIGIYYDNYLLPEGAIFFVYNESEEMVHGAYSALNNQDDGLFATPLVEGDTIILEYFEPDDASFNGNIEIERIVHDYRNILNFNNLNTPSSRCGTNVVCPEGEDFIDQINAGSWLDMGSYICSGSMINNTSNDLTPFYMTAWHCTDGLNESTFRFYFNYETETCEGSNSSYGAYSYGSIIRSSSNGNDPDFTLLEITDEISDTWDDVFYAGWDRSSSPPLINSGVHHPGGDPKKINFDDDYAQHSPGINWQDIGYSPPGSHWGVIWDVGCTEGGSSGSPAYNSDGRFIGQLTGGNSWAYYGKFSRGWDGDSPATRLKDWLDPDNTNQMTLDGIYVDPNHPVFELNSVTFAEVSGDNDSVINPGETGEFVVNIEVPEVWLTGASNVTAVLVSGEQGLTITNEEFFIPYANPGDTYDNSSSPFLVNFDAAAMLGEYQFNLFLAYNGPGDTSYDQYLDFTFNLTLDQQGWPFVTPNQVVTSPAIVDINGDSEPEVIFSDYNGFVRIVNVAGEELCSFDTGNQIWGSPAVGDIDNDNELEIITTSKSKHLYVLDSGCNLELDYDAGQFLMGTPALGDIDGDGELEIVFGGYSSPGKLFAINPDGSDVPGFPYEVGEKIQKGVALADFNGNGKVDIVCGTDGENLWLIYDDLTVADGFPVSAGSDFRTAPAVMDLNGEKIILAGSRDNSFYGVNSDGSIRFQVETGDDINTSPGFVNTGNEIGIFFGSSDGNIYGTDSEGNALPGWPQSAGGDVNSSPVFADLDNDGNAEIIAGTESGSMLAYHLDGTAFPLFPIIYGWPFKGAPSVLDTDNDGDLEILMGSGGSVVNVDFKDIGNSNDYWNMFRGNLHRTGYFEATATTSQVTVNQIADWNLVGLPMEVTDPYYLTVYPEAIEGTLFSFDDNYNLEENFSLGEGYWLRFLDAGSTTISGMVVTTLTVPLAENWNLISGITTAVNVTDIDDPNNLIIPGTFYTFTVSYELTETLNPGFGYWVRSSGDGGVTITSSSTAAKSLPFRNRLREANSLTFSNGDNSLLTLHFGVTVPEKEKLRYSLPPLPPKEGFDVRFSGDWRYTEEQGEILIQNDRYPLVINYENRQEIEAGMEWILVNPQDDKEFVLNNGEIQITAPVQSLFLTKRNIVPQEFVLHQNYPNPFNPVTSLSYDLPERSQVTLTVYDLMGREVSQLVNTTQEAGFRSVMWNATDSFGKPVSAGVYLYQMRASEFVQTRKMILLK